MPREKASPRVSLRVLKVNLRHLGANPRTVKEKTSAASALKGRTHQHETIRTTGTVMPIAPTSSRSSVHILKTSIPRSPGELTQVTMLFLSLAKAVANVKVDGCDYTDATPLAASSLLFF